MWTVKNKAAQALAKLRHLSLTPERRKEIGRLAAKARWAKRLSTPALAKKDTVR